MYFYIKYYVAEIISLMSYNFFNHQKTSSRLIIILQDFINY